MDNNYSYLYKLSLFVSVVFILFSLVFPGILASSEVLIAIPLMLLVGIPHGATDHLIFLQLRKSFLGGKHLEQFYLNYLLLMAVYSVIWWLLPILALAIFLILSVYHFGQSNWHYINFENKIQAWATYLNWGSFALFVPIFWHFETAIPILSSITRSEVVMLNPTWRQALCLIFLLTNVWMTCMLAVNRLIDRRQLLRELFNLLILSCLFVFTPLILGFVIYFVFWHSMSSIADQIRFFKDRVAGYSWQTYVRQALPLSLVAVIGLGLLYMLQTSLGIQPNLGLLFIFISVITLPHMILIDLLYGEWESSESAEVDHARNQEH